jgi:hypothetical protein
MTQDPLMNSCRICLMENSIMVPIFGEDGFYRKIREMVKDALNIVVSITYLHQSCLSVHDDATPHSSIFDDN